MLWKDEKEPEEISFAQGVWVFIRFVTWTFLALILCGLISATCEAML